MKISRNNNITLIRLLAAFVVMTYHILPKMGIDGHYVRLIPQFNGTMTFYLICGFLIFASYDNKRSLKQYFINRIGRIYPALIVMCLITAVIGLATTIIDIHSIVHFKFWKWILSVCSGYERIWVNQDVVNFSLWTIPIELSFYLIVPILFLFPRKSLTPLLILLSIISIVLNYKFHSYTPINIFSSTIIPYFYLFAFGGILYLNWEKMKSVFENKFLFFFITFLIFDFCFGFRNAHTIHKISTLFCNYLWCCVIISAAFSYTKVGAILKENDISYGIYIYHAVVFMIFKHYNLLEPIYIPLVFLFSIGFGIASWKFIEKPILSSIKRGIKHN